MIKDNAVGDRGRAEREAIVAWLRDDADRCERDAPAILAKLIGSEELFERETEAWASLVASKRGIANAIERGDHLPQPNNPVTNSATKRRTTRRKQMADITEAAARAYFERGFIAAAAWYSVKGGDTPLTDDVIDDAWAHRDEGVDAEDALPSLAP